MIKFLLKNTDLSQSTTIKLMTRIQLILSKINNKTINKNNNDINNTLIPLIMNLLKITYLDINKLSSSSSSKQNIKNITNNNNNNLNKDDLDDLDNIDIDDIIIVDNNDNNKNNKNNKNINNFIQDWQSLNWLRSHLLSLLICSINIIEKNLDSTKLNEEILINCMKNYY